MAGGYILKIISSFIYLQVILCYKLNVPRVLLPIFSDVSAKFTLEATEGGCYKWSTTRPDIINLTPIDVDHDFHCSSKVVISSISKKTARDIAIVLAEDVNSKLMLRSDVIVDVINNLSIITTTRELFMGEAPEAFEVRAYDSQGNEFSTLKGVEFQWEIRCIGSAGATVLQFMTFSESPYETPSTVTDMEAANKRGHIVLLEGVKTGCVKVSVKLPYSEYNDVKPIEVLLSVIANLLVLPADAYVLAGDTVKFQLIHMNNGVMEEIAFPDSQFFFEVESESLASVDKTTGEVTALAEGNTRVVLHDRNADPGDPNLKLPAAQLTIVAPAYILLTILPHKNWAILVSEHHDIVAEVYSRNDNKFTLGSNVQIHTQVGDLFQVQERSKNGSWLSGWATKMGSAIVQARLESVVHPDKGIFNIETELSAQATLNVYSQILLKPSEIVLPWDPHKKPKYERQISATGGDNRFLWSSSNHSVGVVTQTGRVRTHSVGSFEVSAAMMKNHHNRQTALFYIVPPVRLEVVEFIMEAEVGTEIYIHVALYAAKSSDSQMPFTQCQDLPFKVTLSHPSFIYNKTSSIPPVGIACATIAVIGRNVGMSTVEISYIADGVALEDVVTVGTYKKLEVIQPKACEIVLAVGTSLNVVFSGGPLPIPGKESLHTRKAESLNPAIAQVQDVSDPQKVGEITLKVLCSQIGETRAKLSVTNGPCLPNSKNQESVATMKVVCSQPKAISLQPESQMSNTSGCPLGVSATRVIIQSDKDIELSVVVTDGDGRKFMNISSFKFDWSLQPSQLGELKENDGVITKEVVENGVPVTDKNIQIVSPKSQTGTMEVSATISSYHDDKLIAQGLPPQSPDSKDFLVTTAIHLSVVDDAVIAPNITSVFNHPGNRKLLTVNQGSGYYELTLSADNLANVKYIEVTRQIEIIPLKDGELKITVIDLCLPSNPTVIRANIVSVSSIRVEMSDKVEIGRCISCLVKLYDDCDELLSVPDMNMINLEYDFDHDIAKLKRVNENSKMSSAEIEYILTGTELGDTKLTFSIGETSSAPLDLQVFSPLQSSPKFITLVVGAVLQLSSKGGPSPDCGVEYTVDDSDIAEVGISGLAKALALGNSKIRARAVGINPTTGLKILYSEDTIELSVIPITGIKISAPLLRFQIGSTVPAWASGIPDQLTPMIIGTVDPPFKFVWSASDKEVINVHGIFKEHGIDYAPEDDISVRITGLAPGRATLNLKASIPGAAAGSGGPVEYTSTVEIEVFEKLSLLNPQGISGSFILMAPHCSVQLETNLDSSSKLRYNSPGPDPPLDAAARKSLSIPSSIVTISDNGLLKSHGLYGKTMVLVTALDEFGLKQTISLIVEVKPVQYMLLSVVSNWKTTCSKVVPLGTEFELHVTYHDNIGAEFLVGNSELGIRTSRFDLAKIRPGPDNSSVYVSTKKEGYTMVKVWADGFHKTADYVKLNVGKVVSPKTDHLTTGDVVCACTSVHSTNNCKGKWSSSDQNLLRMNPTTGVGFVEGTKSGSVSISHSLHPSAALQLEVVPSNQITMMPDTCKPLVNSLSAPPYKVPLVLASEMSIGKTNNVVCDCKDKLRDDDSAINYPFTCSIAFSADHVIATDVFKINPGFDKNTGQYSCDITAKPTNSPIISTLSTTVSIWATLTDGSVQAVPAEIPFVPAIFTNTKLKLDSSNQGNLDVHGLDSVLDQVSVEPKDKSLFEIGGAERPQGNLLRYRVTLLDYHWKLDELGDPMNIIVTSIVTEEVVTVNVRTDGVGASTSLSSSCNCNADGGTSGPTDSFKYMLVIIVSMITILIITYLLYSYLFQSQVNVNVPDRGRSPRGPGRSPGTPTGGNQCAYVRYAQQGSSRRNVGTGGQESVYGDPTSFYCSCPDTSRNSRRYM